MNKSSIADNASPFNKRDVITKTVVEPDTVTYSSNFYAPHHMPSYQERPGNNTLKTSIYSTYKAQDTYYNLSCYNMK
jgi:hypothetical protein